MSHRPLVLALAATLVLPALIPSASRAGGEPRTHDGFFLRLGAGGGNARNTLEYQGDKLEFSGTAANIDIAIGGVVAPNLALHGTLFGWGVTDPDLKLTSSVDSLTATGTAKGTATLSAVGVGLTYYYMPVNAYITGSVGTATFEFDPEHGQKSDTKDGVAFEIGAGKEWWVGTSWGLGAAVNYIYSSLPDKDINRNWNGNAVHVLFSATFN